MNMSERAGKPPSWTFVYYTLAVHIRDRLYLTGTRPGIILWGFFLSFFFFGFQHPSVSQVWQNLIAAILIILSGHHHPSPFNKGTVACSVDCGGFGVLKGPSAACALGPLG